MPFGYTKLNKVISFSGSSTANIDMSNSGNPGFDLYLRTAWPNAGQAGSWRTGSATDPGLISVSKGILTVSDYTGTGQFSLATAISDGGSGYVGYVVPPGGCCIRINWACDPANFTTGHNNWDSVWGQSLNFLLGGLDFVETDFDERFPTGTGTGTHDANVFDWTMPGATNNEVARDFGIALDAKFHASDYLNVPMAQNGGTGLIRSAFDDVHIIGMDMSYSATGGSSPAASPSNPTGVFSEMDTDSRVILLNAGPGMPISVANIQVWSA